MKVLSVDREKILSNLETIREKSENANVIAVLKANAYGLDMRQMAGLLSESGIRRFAVTDPVDAVKLREWGFSEEEILIMRSTACEEEIEQIISSTATATIGSYDAAVALNGMAERDGIMVDVHIKVDTGMGRYGFESSELERITSVYRFMSNLNITGMYTHYANAFCSKRKTRDQYEAFMALVQRVRDAGFEPGLLHASNSAAVFYCGVPTLDAVRVGSAIGGRMTAKGEFGLQKVGRLESEAVEVRWLPKGHAIGYGSAYTTKKPTRIAILPVGTGDGFMVEKARDTFRFRDSFRYAASSLLSFLRGKRFYVNVGGKRARILGHVGISHTIVDVTELDCAPGTKAVFEVSPVFVPERIDRKYV